MNFKKLSVATALSIGMMTIGGMAKADTGAACPICPPPQVQCPQPCAPVCDPCATGAACPVQTQILVPQAAQPMEILSPVCPSPACDSAAVMSSNPIQTCLPNCAPNAKVIRRQAYAFPDIGSSNVIIPKGDQVVQIGGQEEGLAVNANPGCGRLSGVPSYCSALSVIPKDNKKSLGAAAPICPVQVTQGLEISRCSIPNTTRVLQTSSCNPCMQGAAMPIMQGAAIPIMQGAAIPINPCQPCMPLGAACPVSPCDPCNPCNPRVIGFAAPCDPCQPYMPLGAACPVSPCDPCNPCNPCAPVQQYVPLGAACPVNPCDPCNPCAPVQQYAPLGAACPVSPCDPCNPCAPLQQFAPLGAASPLNPNNLYDPRGNALTGQFQGQPRSIQTSSGLQIQRTVLAPVTIAVPTGAACPAEQFPDVSNSAVSGTDINKLGSKGILAGFPDSQYKPNMPIMRDEFASALVSALELQNVPDFQQQIFKDVPLNHWANADIDKAYNRGLLAGYPNCTFNPDGTVTRAEALSTMAKAIPGEMAACDAQAILSQYCDANKIPGWASMAVAESLAAGLIKTLPDCNTIKPNIVASRSEIATMLEQLRIKLALEPCPVTTGAAVELQPQIVAATIPTLKMKFEDIISARTSEVGDRFVAKTTEAVNIDGILYPAGSEVRGKVAEVIRPGLGENGAIRVDFHSIGYNGAAKTSLPREILSATVIEEDNPNILGRLFGFPFSWPGKVAGIAGRTVGGAFIIAGNTVEGILTNVGNGNNELLNGKVRAAGRSYIMPFQDLAMGVFDTARLAVSGTFGVLKESGDELAYVVKPDGSRISQINPNEILSVAFAIQQ